MNNVASMKKIDSSRNVFGNNWYDVLESIAIILPIHVTQKLVQRADTLGIFKPVEGEARRS